MKKLFLILVFILAPLSAQEIVETDSVDIRAIVTEQINSIRDKESNLLNDSAAITAQVIPPIEEKVFEAKENLESKKTSLINESEVNQAVLISNKDYTNYIIFFMIEVGFAVSLILLWIKRREINNKYAAKYLKINIAKLRKEKIGTRFDADLTKLRLNLAAQPIKVNDHGKDITYKAKKYSISKGEVHLAAKLKMLAEKSK